MLKTINGYNTNKVVEEKNISAINEYKRGGQDTLVLYKFINEQYCWSMPYISPYHLNKFKAFYEIPDNVFIEWID